MNSRLSLEAHLKDLYPHLVKLNQAFIKANSYLSKNAEIPLVPNPKGQWQYTFELFSGSGELITVRDDKAYLCNIARMQESANTILAAIDGPLEKLDKAGRHELCQFCLNSLEFFLHLLTQLDLAVRKNGAHYDVMAAKMHLGQLVRFDFCHTQILRSRQIVEYLRRDFNLKALIKAFDALVKKSERLMEAKNGLKSFREKSATDVNELTTDMDEANATFEELQEHKATLEEKRGAGYYAKNSIHLRITELQAHKAELKKTQDLDSYAENSAPLTLEEERLQYLMRPPLSATELDHESSAMKKRQQQTEKHDAAILEEIDAEIEAEMEGEDKATIQRKKLSKKIKQEKAAKLAFNQADLIPPPFLPSQALKRLVLDHHIQFGFQTIQEMFEQTGRRFTRRLQAEAFSHASRDALKELAGTHEVFKEQLTVLDEELEKTERSIVALQSKMVVNSYALPSHEIDLVRAHPHEIVSLENTKKLLLERLATLKKSILDSIPPAQLVKIAKNIFAERFQLDHEEQVEIEHKIEKEKEAAKKPLKTGGKRKSPPLSAASSKTKTTALTPPKKLRTEPRPEPQSKSPQVAERESSPLKLSVVAHPGAGQGTSVAGNTPVLSSQENQLLSETPMFLRLIYDLIHSSHALQALITLENPISSRLVRAHSTTALEEVFSDSPFEDCGWGITPLIAAALSSETEADTRVVAKLLEKKADVNAVITHPQNPFYGASVLMIAAHADKLNLIKLLIRHGALIDAVNDRNEHYYHWSAFDYAVAGGAVEVAQFLLNLHAPCKAKKSGDSTPLPWEAALAQTPAPQKAALVNLIQHAHRQQAASATPAMRIESSASLSSTPKKQRQKNEERHFTPSPGSSSDESPTQKASISPPQLRVYPSTPSAQPKATKDALAPTNLSGAGLSSLSVAFPTMLSPQGSSQLQAFAHPTGMPAVSVSSRQLFQSIAVAGGGPVIDMRGAVTVSFRPPYPLAGMNFPGLNIFDPPAVLAAASQYLHQSPFVPAPSRASVPDLNTEKSGGSSHSHSHSHAHSHPAPLRPQLFSGREEDSPDDLRGLLIAEPLNPSRVQTGIPRASSESSHSQAHTRPASLQAVVTKDAVNPEPSASASKAASAFATPDLSFKQESLFHYNGKMTQLFWDRLAKFSSLPSSLSAAIDLTSSDDSAGSVKDVGMFGSLARSQSKMQQPPAAPHQCSAEDFMMPRPSAFLGSLVSQPPSIGAGSGSQDSSGDVDMRPARKPT